jgi:hypothetical protein
LGSIFFAIAQLPGAAAVAEVVVVVALGPVVPEAPVVPDGPVVPDAPVVPDGPVVPVDGSTVGAVPVPNTKASITR